jgi:hypothetical protein
MKASDIKVDETYVLIASDPSFDWNNGLCKVKSIDGNRAFISKIGPTGLEAEGRCNVPTQCLHTIQTIQLLLNPYWEPGY